MALVRSDLVCPASKEISTVDVLKDEFKRSKVVPALIGILVGTLLLGLGVGLLLLLTVRFRQGTPTHNLLTDKLQRLVLSHHCSQGKGARRARQCFHACYLHYWSLHCTGLYSSGF